MVPTDIINKNGLYDIYPLWHIPFWRKPIFYLSLTIIAVMLCIGIIMWAIVRYRKKAKKPVSYWQQAINELEALHKKKYATKLEGKQCYFMLTAVVKQYLAKRYGLNTLEKTDSELIHYVQSHQEIPKKICDYVSEVCKGCVLIKFADQAALQEHISNHIDMCIKIILETKPSDDTHKQLTQQKSPL